MEHGLVLLDFTPVWVVCPQQPTASTKRLQSRKVVRYKEYIVPNILRAMIVQVLQQMQEHFTYKTAINIKYKTHKSRCYS